MRAVVQAFEKNRAQLTAFVQEPLALRRLAHLAFGCDFQPEVGLVGFFEHDPESRP